VGSNFEWPSWSYGSCIYNYLCNRCLSPLMWVRISLRARCTTYVIKFVSDLRQVSGFLRVLWFPPPIKLTAMIHLYIVESAVKHHKTKPNFEIVYYIDVLQNPNTLYIQIYNVDILTTPCTSAYPDLLTCIGPIRFFVCMLYNTVHVHLVAFTLNLLLLHHTCDYMIHIRNI